MNKQVQKHKTPLNRLTSLLTLKVIYSLFIWNGSCLKKICFCGYVLRFCHTEKDIHKPNYTNCHSIQQENYLLKTEQEHQQRMFPSRHAVASTYSCLHNSKLKTEKSIEMYQRNKKNKLMNFQVFQIVSYQ